jgi:hypothetical protein
MQTSRISADSSRTEGVPLRSNAAPDEMNFSQIQLAKDAGCLSGSQGFCKSRMAEIQSSDGDERF